MSEETTIREDVIEVLRAAGFEVRDNEGQFAVTGTVDSGAALIERIIESRDLSAALLKGWIDVEEQQPEHDQRVLVVFWPYDNRENEQIVGEAMYWDGGFYTHEGDDHHPPSHWMPMPQLPGAKS